MNEKKKTDFSVNTIEINLNLCLKIKQLDYW